MSTKEQIFHINHQASQTTQLITIYVRTDHFIIWQEISHTTLQSKVIQNIYSILDDI